MTKNNLSKCLAWLLQHESIQPSLEHLTTIPTASSNQVDTRDIEDEGSRTGPEMARLQLAPQSVSKSRLLARERPGNVLPTPAPSHSPLEQPPTVDKFQRAKTHATPAAQLPHPKTPASFYDDSVFDIDDIDELLDEPFEDLTTSSYGEFGTPKRLWTEDSATRVEPVQPTPKGKKRKSDEIEENLTSHVSKRIVSPKKSAKRQSPEILRSNDIFGDKDGNDDLPRELVQDRLSTASSVGSKTSNNTQDTIKPRGRQSSSDEVELTSEGLGNEFQPLSKASQGIQLVEKVPLSAPSARRPYRAIVPDSDSDSDPDVNVVPSPTKSMRQSPQKDLGAESKDSRSDDGRSPAVVKDSPCTKQPSNSSIVKSTQLQSKVQLMKHSHENVTLSSSPHSSESSAGSNAKLTTEERQELTAFLNASLETRNAFVAQLEQERKELSFKFTELICEGDDASAELMIRIKAIKSRISAMRELPNHLDNYTELCAYRDSLKKRLQAMLEEDEDVSGSNGADECNLVVSRIRSAKPQLDLAERTLYTLIQQAEWSASMVSVTNTPKISDQSSRGPHTSRNVLVASTQHARNQHKADLPLESFQSPRISRIDTQPVRQTPLPPRSNNTKFSTHLFEDPRHDTETFDRSHTYCRGTEDVIADNGVNDEFEDAFEDDEDMLDAAQAFEDSLSKRYGSNSQNQRPRSTLSQISDNINRKPLKADKKAAVSPLKQYTWSKDVNMALRKRFHLQGFRHNQLEAINATLSGKDAFVLMPTGGGKSLCYQLPSIIQSGRTHGVTIVISPLLSLMQDQVDHLQKLQIQAFMINGESTTEHKNYIYQALRDPQPERLVQLLYVTPELLSRSQAMSNKFADLHRRQKLARIVIDEAHCVSQWGHDFRPDYKLLGDIRADLAGVPVMALTATATENVKVDVIHNLKMEGCDVFTQSFNRPNLSYEVRPKGKASDVLDSIAETINQCHNGESGIIYCLSRKNCENVAKKLCEQYSISATHYHAGMDAPVRMDVQKKWQAGKYKVIVATIAFGMGIDKADVRFVIHQTIPKTLEGYYQETGRAGRDGKPSQCYLYYGYGDTTSLKRMIEDNKEADWQQKERQKQMLRNVVQFCENRSDCRRVQVLAYFNEHFRREQCNDTCDNCQSDSVFETQDFSEHARSIIQLVRQVQDSQVTLLHCVDVYRGAKGKKIVDLGHDQLKEWGLGSELDRGNVERCFYRLISEDALEEYNIFNKKGFPLSYVTLGAQSEEFKNRRRSLRIQVRISPQAKLKAKPAARKKVRGTGVLAADDCPASTNISSPIEMRKQAKRKLAPGPRLPVFDEEESDDGLGDFAPVRTAGAASRSKKAATGPPIASDDQLAQLNDAHRSVLETFVNKASSELTRIMKAKNLRLRPLSNTVLRQIGIRFPTNEKELSSIEGITEAKVKLYGPLLLREVRSAHADYLAIMSVNSDENQESHHRNIVEISDDDIDGDAKMDYFSGDDDDDGDDCDPEPEAAERSRYFSAVGTDFNVRQPISKARGSSTLRTQGSSRRKVSQSRSSGSGVSRRGSMNRGRGRRASPSHGVAKKTRNSTSRASTGAKKGVADRGGKAGNISHGPRGVQASLIGMMPT